MKNKFLSVAVIVAALVLGLVIFGCGNTGDDKERVTVSFDINYDGGENPPSISVFIGTAAGSRWPDDPKRQAHSFNGWLDGTKRYNRNTLINKDVTVVADWVNLPETKPSPSSEVVAELFDTSKGFPATLSDSRKIWGMRNPLITFSYLADPVPMVFCHANPPCIQNSGQTSQSHCDKCRLYMYGSNDALAFNDAGAAIPEPFGIVIQGLRIISSDDLVNWTDHGPQNFVAKTSTHPLFPNPTVKIAEYASDTWAPSAEWKIVNGKPQFYLYWCNSGTNTSVVVSDISPVGPWRNPGLTRSMIDRAMPNANSEWLFDPGTMMEEDGTAYIVLGGGGGGANPGNARRAQLNDNMYSIVGDVETYNAPYMFEASDIWKWKGIYYLNYTTNWSVGGNPYGFSSIDVGYMMNREGPMGTFNIATGEFGAPKRLLPNGNYGDSTNHASLFDYKGEPYLVYHASSACRAYGITRLRVAHLGKVNVNADSSLQPMVMGVQGVDQVGDFNPYNVTEAETMAIGGGIYTKHDDKASNSIVVASIDTGDWLGLYGVNFGSRGATKFNAIVKMPVTNEGETYIGAIEIRIDPVQQGISSPNNNTILSTSPNQQSRITGGEVVGRIQLEANKEDEGKFVVARAELEGTITGKHDLAFVFYSNTGVYLEKHNVVVNRDNDGRARNVGFEFDQWWFD